MLKLIVFDWDGTLVDSVSKIIECKIFLAKKYNLPKPNIEVIKNVLGTEFKAALANCFPNINQAMLNELGKEFHYLMQQDYYQALLFPHAYTVLDLFKKQGITLAIATSKSREELNKSLMYTNSVRLFDETCCGKEYEEKPNPAMLEYLLTKFDAKPNECLMIGDTTTDVLFAHNANIKTICVTFGAHTKANLQMVKPLAFIDKWVQLPEVIKGLCYLTPKYYPSSLQD